MAKKTSKPRSPLPEPPTLPSSHSSEEEQIPPSQQHHEEEDEDDDEDETSSEEEEEENQPVSKNPPSNTQTKPESDTDSDSGSESDTPPPPPTNTNTKLKPLPSKPTDQTPKPNSKPHPSKKDRSASKRPVENNEPVKDAKRAKNKGTDISAAVTVAAAAAAAVSSSDDEVAAKKPVNDSRKLFQRLWSEEDEIAILKGMVEFTSKTGNDPYKYADAFYDFMMKSLHAKASSNQLKEKIRRLKQKFERNARKGKNGEGPSFSKPHDQEAFEISKKVWGDVEKAVRSPTKEARTMKVVATPKAKRELQHELRSLDSKKAVEMNGDEKADTTSYLTGLIQDDKGFGFYGLKDDMVKRGMELIGESQKDELMEQWKEVQHYELKLSVKRAELIASQARLILEACKSSSH